jgi:uncharacterized membrane protein HdeD (DUF308 family)
MQAARFDGGVDVMLKRPWRRAIAIALIVLGGLAMLLSPSVEIGAIAFALGVVVELAGLAIEHRQSN